MYDFVIKELPQVIEDNFAVDSQRKSISGHSMGGHGALTIAIKNPKAYQSVSAFAPICAPSQCPWGQKAFSGYLGEDKATWQQYDTNALVSIATEKISLYIDQGEKDPFLHDQLMPNTLDQTCQEHNFPITLHMRSGYDHSYYFVASFIEDHLHYHAKHLQ
jgi:S-formylglutathione hydrolase